MLPLEGKTALVTGAGRARGIGRAAALELARQGADVIVTDLARPSNESMVGLPTVATDRTELDNVVLQIEKLGRESLGLSVDVTNEVEVQEAVERATASFGAIDVLFNNAGTPLGAQPFLDLGDEDWDLSWSVNVMGIVHLCRHVVPVMQNHGGGSIVNNSSAAGLKVLPGYAAYSVTKAAAIGLTKALALDFGEDGIRVNAVCPGDIDTQMGDIARRLATRAPNAEPPPGGDVPTEAIALGRRGLPEDVASVVAWLASEASSYVTGATIPVDGAMPQGL